MASAAFEGVRVVRLAATVMVVAGVAMVAAASAAVLDHRHKVHVLHRLQLAEWYCEHREARCGGPSSAAAERRWNERERGYVIVLAVGGAGFVAAAVAFVAARRR